MGRLTIAVVVPTIPGREVLLAEALVSVTAQHRRPDEVIVEPDPDRTGAAATRNRALARVTSDLVAWVDDDDRVLRHHLGALERALGDADLVYSTPRMMSGQDPTATSVGGRWVKPWGVPFGPEQEWHLRAHGSFIPITHMVRTDLVRQAGGFPAGRTLPDGRYQGEDERYLLALLDAGARFRHVDVVTWLWRGHPGTSTAGRGVEG